MIATPAPPLTPPAADPDLVAAVRRLAAWAGRPCTDAEAAAALRDVLAGAPDQPREPAGSPEGGQFAPAGGGGGAEDDGSYRPGSGEGTLYVTRRGSGRPDPGVNEAARAGHREYLDRVYPDGRYKDGFPGAVDPEINEVATLARDVLRANTEKGEPLVPFWNDHPDAWQAELWGRDGPVLTVSRDRKGLTVGGLNGRVRVPDGAPPGQVSYLVHRVSGNRPPAALRERWGPRRGPPGAAAAPGLTAYSPDQPRDEAGRFGEGGGGGKAGGALARLGRTTWDGVKKAGAAAAHVEHVVKEWVRDTVEAGLSRLPPKAQAVARGVLRVAAVGSKLAFATHLAGQAAAEAVARQRGLSPEQARTLRGTLATLDTALCKPVALAGELTGVGGLGVSLVPVASAGYLAYSTARDPMATYRAARGGVRAVGKRLGLLKGAAMSPRAQELIPLVADRYKGLTGEALDWYAALLAVALDEAGDLEPALKIAEAAFAEYGTAAAAPEGDPDPLLAEED